MKTEKEINKMINTALVGIEVIKLSGEDHKDMIMTANTLINTLDWVLGNNNYLENAYNQLIQKLEVLDPTITKRLEEVS